MILLWLSIVLSGCAAVTTRPPSPLPPEPTFLAPAPALQGPSASTLEANAVEARDVMLRFFNALHTGEYATAISLYAGSYETLQTWNPDVPTSDLTSLWQRACEQNGLQCLELLEVVGQEQVSANVMKFILHFRNRDGTLFVLGPCCGETATTMPPVSEFECDVARNSSGEFKVLCLPPYVP